jgi:hypothetical protein
LGIETWVVAKYSKGKALKIPERKGGYKRMATKKKAAKKKKKK